MNLNLSRPGEKNGNYSHGHYLNGRQSPGYRAYHAMMTRCTNPRQDNYVNYGGRGIKVCDRWRNSFAAFLEDMGLKPAPSYSIERRNNDGDYEPKNCYWAERKAQTRNRRGTRRLSYNGDERPLAEWAEIVGINYVALLCRIKRGWPVEEVLGFKKHKRSCRRSVDQDKAQAVKAIRVAVAAGERQADVAERFGCSQSLVSQIALGLVWAHVS